MNSLFSLITTGHPFMALLIAIVGVVFIIFLLRSLFSYAENTIKPIIDNALKSIHLK